MNSNFKCKGINKLAIVLLTFVMIIASLPALAFADEYDSTKSQVHVVIKNDIYAVSEGASWEGTLLDSWVSVDTSSTIMSAVKAALNAEEMTADGLDSGYITDINGLSAGSPETSSGWMITLNDWMINQGADQINVSKGDEIVVAFSKDGGEDLGGSYLNNLKTLKSLSFSEGTLSPEFSSNVTTYTLTLVGGANNNIKVTPTASNKNFLVKTYLGTQESGTLYPRNSDIPVSDKSVITVVCGDSEWPTMNIGSADITKETYTINVVVNEPVNNAPNVKDSAISAAEVTLGNDFTLDLSTIFEDKDNDTLTYTVSIDGAESVSANKSYTYTPSKEGSVNLKFSANDGKVSVEHSIVLTVNKANTPPNVKTGVSTTAQVSAQNRYSVRLSNIFEDKDNDTLTYTVSINGAAPVKANNSYSYTPTVVGNTTLTFTASDGKASVSHTITLVAVNDAPNVKKNAATTAVNKLGETYTIDLSTIFEDKNKDILTYSVSIDGAQFVAADKLYAYTPTKVGESVLKFKANDAALSSPEHTITLSTLAESVVTFKTTPSDALVRVYEGTTQLQPNDKGEYKVNIGYTTYIYEVVKAGYIGKSAEITNSGEIVVELQKLNNSAFAPVDAYWPAFRGNDSNMAIVDVKLPIDAEKTQLSWNKQLGSSWADAPSVQIIADNSLVVMCNKKIYKLDLANGNILKEGELVEAPSYGYVPPLYAEGLIICPLGNGTIQAFNAKTLESVWIYRDILKGQAQTPICYSDGCIYTGFYNGDAKDANFVCLAIADEDPSSTNEEKLALWKVTHMGGFYWSGACVIGDYVVVGSDDGVKSTVNATSTLYCFNKLTGEVVNKALLEDAGDIRSTISYDEQSGKIYFTTKAARVYSAVVNKTTGELTDIKYAQLTGKNSTCTPIVYNGRIYVYTYSTNGCFNVIDEKTMQPIFTLDGTGNAQSSPLMSTAYEDEGYLYFYGTYNATPGGICMVKVKTDAKSSDDAQVIDLYDADGFSNFCVCSIICGPDGTLYYKNDSLNILAVEKINTPPNVKEGAFTSAIIDLKDKFTLDLSTIFEDKDDDSLTYTVSVDGKEAVNALQNYELTPDKSGNIELKFTASDGKASAEHKITLKVNVSPNVKDGAAKSGEVDQYTTFTLDLSTIFEDKDNDELTYTVSVDGGDAVAVTKNYKITPNKAGIINLKFVASDGRKTVEHKFTLVVNKVYVITSGNDSTWVIDSTKDIVITCDGPFDEFVGLMIDGEMLEDDDYIAEEGSTVVTLKPEYLSKLTIGEHDITFAYESQNVDGVFTIKDLSTPKTGDNIDNLILLGIAMSVSAIGIYSINKRRKHN